MNTNKDSSDYHSLLKDTLLSVLRGSNQSNLDPRQLDHESPERLREVLGDVLIASNNKYWKEDTLSLIDQIWTLESNQRQKFSLEKDIPNLQSIKGTQLFLWQGDIAQLQGYGLAIVNAANDQGLGCFVPHHKCIDNIIHRGAGPRLRMECQQVMQQRDGIPLAAGTKPIVTSSYFLPSSHVIHVTGPQVVHKGRPSRTDRHHLSQAYELSLDLAAATPGIRSIAFPCISTGLFGFPQQEASETAISTVISWLLRNPGTLDKVVFNVFTDKDLALYRENLQAVQMYADTKEEEEDVTSIRQRTIDLAKQWINQADAVLICAGAGMSVKEGELVYTNPDDFAKAYPWFLKWGYKTSYECMGLPGDRSVPENAKWALNAKHMDNMRWTFTPNEGYHELLSLVGDKDHFVLTSNVDACFERSGFNPNKIYTPQGEWTYLQCMNACQEDSVFESRPYIDKILPHISEDGFVPKELIPKCPRCGSKMFGNVRGGDWYLHHKYEDQNVAIQQWMQDKIDSGLKVAVIEVGAGFNTPTVTRFPVEAFARELGNDRAFFIRINPTEAEVPEDLKAIALEEGWQVLAEIGQSQGIDNNDKSVEKEEEDVKQALKESNLMMPKHFTMRYRRYFRHFDWRKFLDQLRN